MKRIGPHLRYLKYVLLHKFYVLRAGLVIGPASESWVAWVWRLLVHDLSKFSRAEWSPYVAQFYKPKVGPPENAERQADFNRAWLHHIHANPHHWQHWMLHLDNGKTLVLIPAADLVHEMVADWMAAGSKILSYPAMQTCVAETIVWYGQNMRVVQLRAVARDRVELLLATLAERYGLRDYALSVQSAKDTRASLTVDLNRLEV